MQKNTQLKVEYVPVTELNPSTYNPRRWSEEKTQNLADSIKKYGLVDPLLVNSAPERRGTVIGGHFRLKVALGLGYTEVPVVYLNIPDVIREKELNLRLNANLGDWDFDLLAQFDESLLADIGFTSEEIDEIFDVEENPEEFDLQKELEKLNIVEVTVKKGDIWQLGDHRVMCGDSTIEDDMLFLMNGQNAQMCFTDPPYILDYLHGKKKHGTATEGFGYKRDRRYLETETLPNNFTELWMANVNNVQDNNFSIICYENWKNLRVIWNEMEKYWKVQNLIIWHLPNRVQGFAAKHKFFNKFDGAMVATDGDVALNFEEEEELLQNEYETALYAIAGKPTWEGYKKGKKFCPTDHIDFHASDEKNSGQGVIFGTKPVEILIPYMKVLTKRNHIVLEPFGGSGSTLIAAEKLKRRCFLMEKSPVYVEVIKARWEKLSGQKAVRIHEGRESEEEVASTPATDTNN